MGLHIMIVSALAAVFLIQGQPQESTCTGVGAEVEAIKGAKQTLTYLRPRIRLAGWYTRGGRKISDITKDQLEALDYQVFIGSRGNTMALPV